LNDRNTNISYEYGRYSNSVEQLPSERQKRGPGMAVSYEQISEMLKALSHPARLKIVVGLLKDECNVAQIQKVLRLPQSTISQHLRVLKNAGVVKGRRE
jgi:DNA-binding transcriptional ArsR family regulator